MNLRANQSWGDLAKQFDKMSGRAGEKEADPRFFVPGKDKEGNIACVIRFLPSPDTPAVLEKCTHYVKGMDGKTYFEHCPRAHGKPCPVCSYAGKAWGDGDKEAYKKWGNSSKYIANIVCINDTVNPDNNGKVFLWEFGATIYKQIDGKVNPQNKLQQPSIVFDYVNGENYNLIGKKNSFRAPDGKVREYDDFKEASGFTGKSSLSDAEIQSFDSQLHDMGEWLPENILKPFDQLKEKFDSVMGVFNTQPSVSTSISSPASTSSDDSSDADYTAINNLLNTKVEASTESTTSNDELLNRLKGLR